MAISNFWTDLILFEEMLVVFHDFLKGYIGSNYVTERDAVDHLYDLNVDFFNKYPNYAKFSTWIQSEIMLEVMSDGYGPQYLRGRGFKIHKLIYT